MQHPVRTSDAAAFPIAQENPALHALNRRIAAASETLAEQILRYQSGQQYRPHSDAMAGEKNQRILTFLIYLNDDFEGGETHFLAPDLKVRRARRRCHPLPKHKSGRHAG
ncbi:2OG-Fe(II) oxygenase [Allosphingosinicella flava]|uniref:2OG-Fe(II) oxygenase n=1 Tax=Allosphingosinicella flava TaxID=2771430 RepID=A0A7T2GKZ7_9SPHN|nr:2OG-Fe(II) oxygenase [Sphingosinicella flava]QPQ55784.1 2OG-Fe(II) oxygenase [Sphingosinicella flava]